MSLVRDWSAQAVAAKLSKPGKGKSKRSGGGWKACCPAHDDNTPSLQLDDGDAGLLYHCFAGCDSKDVFDALRSILSGEGLSGTVRRNEKSERKQIDTFEPVVPAPVHFVPTLDSFHDSYHGQPSSVWTYRTPEGTAGWVARYDTGDGHKEVVPWVWGRDPLRNFEGLKKKGFPQPRPLYHLDRIVERPDDWVIYNEGEKAADAAGWFFPEWIPTTHPGGVNALHLADLSVLEGRRLILAADHDGPGYEMMLAILRLQPRLRDLRLLRWPTHVRPSNGVLVDEPYVMQAGDDMFDHRKAGWTPDLLRQALKTAGHKLAEPVRGLPDEPFEPIEFEE